jgi:hypothetical protein
VLASFQTKDDTFVLSGGDGVLPPRWAQAATTDVVYYLAEGREETAAPPRARRNGAYISWRH